MGNLGCINKKLGLAAITDGIAGTFEIDEGMPDYVATEVKTALEAAGYKITISQPAPAAAA